MNKEEILEAKKELIDMLVWSYMQGYMHAMKVVETAPKPTEEQLKDMFAEHMLNSQGGDEQSKSED